MKFLGQGIAFAALVGAAAWLEINGKPSSGLSIIAGAWAIFGTWHSDEKE